MNEYEAKQAARKDRYLDAADRASTASTAAYNRASKIGSSIPFGQPILVGHHSERGHRADIGRIDSAMRASISASEKADHYAQKAASVGAGGISSDDSDAIPKLTAKLASLERLQESMKAKNKLIKKNDRAGLAALGLTEGQITDLFKPDFCGRIGFPAYAITNNGATIRATKERIEKLEKSATRHDEEIIGNGYICRLDTADNRVCFEFPGKPSEAIRDILKAHAFKWSPTRSAWVRQATGNGTYAARCVKEKLDEVANIG